MSDRDRFELARQQYLDALARLREVLPLDETDIVRDALIQRFEFTYELGWKAMYHWLKDMGENPPKMVRPVLQSALQGQLIVDVGTWERVKDHRDETSHTYNAAKAVEVAAFVRADAIGAFEALAQKLVSL
jgi:nucleotidyltransferase substrate binding protein (TIGR01987 family)